MSSVFQGIEKAEVFGAGLRITPGRHRLQIAELTTHRSRKNGSVFFIVEAIVQASEGGRPLSAREVPAETPVPKSEPLRVGDKVSWLVDLSKPSGLSNVKGFALALAPDMSESDVTEAAMIGMINNDPARGVVQPCAGIVVDCDAFAIITREKGNDFVQIGWSAVSA